MTSYRNTYEEIYPVADRYLELEDLPNADHIRGSLVVVNRALIDIENQLEIHEEGERNLGVFYQLVIKIDALISASEFLYKQLMLSKTKRSKPREQLTSAWGDSWTTIEHFRLIRSLSIAHPLETNHFDTLGFGKDNDAWCEDVRVGSGMMGDTGEFVLLILKSDDPRGNRKQISVAYDLLPAVTSAMHFLERNIYRPLNEKVKQTLDRLSETPIRANSNMPTHEYLACLKKDLYDRYPSCFEVLPDADGVPDNYCIIDSAEKALSVQFEHPEQNDAYTSYKTSMLYQVHAFADDLQHMRLEDDRIEKRPDKTPRNRLENIVYPNTSQLIEIATRQGNAKAGYAFEKIMSYLSESNERSIKAAEGKLKALGYDGCKQMGAVTNAEWAIIQLLSVANTIRRFFPLSFDATDQELYYQVCAAAYYSTLSV